LEELKSLVSTFGGASIVHIIQRRMKPDSHTYIGSGKAEELVTIVGDSKIDVVVVNDIVKATQLFNIKKELWPVNPDIEVWDRVDLILHIFEQHARTSEAKLQIELARMRHMGPRIYGLGGALSRQGGGIGTRGIGETNTELMKRHWRRETKEIQEKLQKLGRDREQQLERRREIGFHTISIVGYTNAGKTSLFNMLTGKHKLARNALFATLDSSVGKLHLPQTNTSVMVSDTIGFIQKLPAKLIDAFKSTLMESIHADILIHVIDASDMLMYDKIHIVEQVLTELHIESKPMIYVFNKMDLTTTINKDDIWEVYSDYSPQFISTKTGDGIDALIQAVEGRISALDVKRYPQV
jgi:GTP-binding protein HflX